MIEDTKNTTVVSSTHRDVMELIYLSLTNSCFVHFISVATSSGSAFPQLRHRTRCILSTKYTYPVYLLGNRSATAKS
jgi:hypothetical protein